MHAPMMKREDFERLVARGIDLLDETYRKRIDNVVFVIEDEPTEEDRRENGIGPNDLLLGLYRGVPQSERGSEYGGLVMPDTITLFQRHIEAAAEDPKDIPAIVADTVWHEVGHHFGLDEHEVREKEEKRRGRR